MHGLIFVAWEKFLFERYGSAVLAAHREAVVNTPASVPLASRVYDDELFLNGVANAAQATAKAMPTLLREYGRYFITCNLTSRLCRHFLAQARNARDLLLIMRGAHIQMSHMEPRAGSGVPLFTYEPLSDDPNELLITYTNQHQLCPMLQGAIEGAALRFGERVSILERSCMRAGARACVLEVRFTGNAKVQQENKVQTQLQRERETIADAILQVLPFEDGMTLQEVRERLQLLSLSRQQTRPSVLLSIINSLYLAGIINSTANQPGDDLNSRRYWRQRS